MSAIVCGNSIEGVSVQSLTPIQDERGMVLPMFRSDCFDLSTLGEIYFSVVNQGHVKGWEKHKLMHQDFAVCTGKIKLVIYDDRPQSSTRGKIQEIVTGRDLFALIHLPRLVWYSYIGLSLEPAVITYGSSMPQMHGEVMRLPSDSPQIPFSWGPRRQAS